MNLYLQQLIKLAKLDKEIDDFEPKIKTITKELNLKKDELDKNLLNFTQLEDEISELKKQKNQALAHIDEFAAKIKEISKKSSSVRNEKEAKALSLEEDITKEQLEATNDEILRLEKIMENKTLFLAELKEQKSILEAELKKIEEGVFDQRNSLEEERKLIFIQKDKLQSEMNQKIISFYEKIRKWALNSAVVPVKKQSCYGCFMRINDKIYAQVCHGEDIITCPHCGRILYKSEEEKIIEEEPKPVLKKRAKKAKVSQEA